MKKFHEWPAVLQRRWLLSGAAGLGFLAVGLVVFLTLHDRALLMISALLTLCIVLRCVSFYRMARSDGYEVVEGVCIEFGRSGMKKQRSVRLLQMDGNEYAVMLDKRTPLRIGNLYRLYFRQAPPSQISGLEQYLAQDQFLGLEDLGEYHDSSEEAPADPAQN